MKQQFSATIKTDFKELKRLSAEVDAFLTAGAFPPEPVYRLELALEEMVTNVIKYGYDQPGPHHEVNLRIAADETALTLVIEDSGHEFNPLLARQPALDKDIADRPIGGVGIHLTRSMVSRMDYQRIDGRNVLTIQVNLATAP